MLLYPTYFSPIIQYVILAQRKHVTYEVEDNYQKQTYRTRCYVFSPNGRQLLNIPVKNANSKQKTKDVLIDYSFDWQKQHLKSIEAAYRSSPFFEFYEDEIRAVYETKPAFLLDFNFRCQDLMIDALQLETTYSKTESYQNKVENSEDLRNLVLAKNEVEYKLEKYTQVFDNKHGFIANLSILDLLCNEGTNALSYLENQNIDML